MFRKKDDHNIPKDFDKSIKKTNVESDKVIAMVGETKKNKLAKPTFKYNGIKPNPKKLAVISLSVVVAIGVLGFFYIQNEKKEDAKIVEVIAVEASRDSLYSASDDEVNDIVALSVSLENPDIYYAKALAYSRQDNNNESLDMFNKLVERYPTVIKYTYDYSLAAMRAGNSELAISLMEKAIELNNNDNSLSEDVRKIELEKFNNKLNAFKDEAGVVDEN